MLTDVRDNGMVTYRAEELAQSGRMLTIFALYVLISPPELPPLPHPTPPHRPMIARGRYVRYTGDRAFLLKHFSKARALGQWLLYRYQLSLEWPTVAPSPKPRLRLYFASCLCSAVCKGLLLERNHAMGAGPSADFLRM